MKKITLLATVVLVAALSAGAADPPKTEKTVGERTRDALDTAAEKTRDALEKAGDTTLEAGRAIKDATKKAADHIVDAVTPDPDAAKVDVNLKEHQIDMPATLKAGKTAFVVRNSGKDKHNFEIQGEGIEKKFLMNLGPDETKVLHVDLKPGTYTVSCPVKDHEADGKLMIKVE